MEDFASYGQVAPGAIQYRHTDPTREIDQQAMGLELQHVDRMIQARDVKQQKIQELSNQISGAQQHVKNSSFITSDNLNAVNDDFMQTVNQIKEHYRTPSNNRDVGWHTQLQNIKSTLVPKRIMNDKKNQEFFAKIEQLRMSDKLSQESYEHWKERFYEVAGRGDDFMEIAQAEGYDPMPVLSNENFIQSGTQLMNSYGGFTMNDFAREGGRYIIKKDAVKGWVQTAGRGLWNDAKKSFFNLPDHIKKFYSPNWMEGGQMESDAIEEYMIQTLRSSFKPIDPDPTGSRAAAERERQDYFIDHILPAMQEAFNFNYEKDINYGQDIFQAMESLGTTDGAGIKSVKRSIPNVTAMFNASPVNDGKRTRVDIALTSEDGEIFELQIPLNSGISAEWGFKDNTGSYDTEIFPTNIQKGPDGKVSNQSYGMVVGAVPLTMNKTNIENLIMSMDGQEFQKFFQGTELEEASGVKATDKIQVGPKYIKIGTKQFDKQRLLEGFLADKAEYGWENKQNEKGESYKRVIDTYSIPSTVIVDDPEYRKTQYNLSFGSHKGIGTSVPNVDLKPIR